MQIIKNLIEPGHNCKIPLRLFSDKGSKMSYSYDPEMFERGESSFVLSQRFRLFCYRFFGTVKLASNLSIRTALSQFLPVPLAYTVLFSNLFFMVCICILIIHESWVKGKHGKYENHEQMDPNAIRAKVVKTIGYVGVLFIVTFTSTLGTIILIKNKELTPIDAYAYFTFVFLSLLAFIKYSIE